ncbi:MAG TPA: hypothetical protein VEN79_05380 [Terriglobia bacterium]|nr:hypothetical protein [Terriglobia bacterium]
MNGRAEGSTHSTQFGAFRSSIQETLDIGKDTGSAVSPLYAPPYPFTGQIDTVTIHLLKWSRIRRVYKSSLIDSHPEGVYEKD